MTHSHDGDDRGAHGADDSQARESTPPGVHLSRREALKGGAAAALLAGTLSPAEALAKDKTSPKVPRRILGKTGKSVPILVFGAAVDLDKRFDPKLAEALRYGVDYFDTADCYGGGNSEVAVGNFLARTKTRKKVWITSKSDLHDPKGFASVVDTSLRKLQTDHIDLYYLHALDDASVLTPALEKKVAELKRAGKIHHFGFSCHSGNVVQLLNKAATLPWVESIMFRYNFRKYGDVELNKAIDACAKANIGLIAMKTQASEVSFEAAWKKFEKTGKWNKHQAVLKAVWEDKRITAAISHMENFTMLRENIAAAIDKTKLGVLEKRALERYAEATRGQACDGCDHLCNPAVEGDVQIGDTLRCLMYHDVYGEKEKALSLFAQLPAGAKNLRQVDFAPANKACPHGVDVAMHMKRAAEIFKV